MNLSQQWDNVSSPFNSKKAQTKTPEPFCMFKCLSWFFKVGGKSGSLKMCFAVERNMNFEELPVTDRIET